MSFSPDLDLLPILTNTYLLWTPHPPMPPFYFLPDLFVRRKLSMKLVTPRKEMPISDKDKEVAHIFIPKTLLKTDHKDPESMLESAEFSESGGDIGARLAS